LVKLLFPDGPFSTRRNSSLLNVAGGAGVVAEGELFPKTLVPNAFVPEELAAGVRSSAELGSDRFSTDRIRPSSPSAAGTLSLAAPESNG